MSKLVLSGDTSGSVTLDAPAVSGTTTLTLPTTTGTLVVTSGAQTIEFADGSASTPSITNSGDTNTGMFFPAADTIAFAEGGTESMRIDSAGNVGIGTTAPTTKLTLSANTALPSAGAITGTNLWQVGADATANNILIDAFGGAPTIHGRRAAGTAASPTAVQSGDNLLNITGFGYGATGYSSGARARIFFTAAENWTDTAQGAHIIFSTTANTTTTTAERMRINSSGEVYIAGTTDQGAYNLQCNGTGVWGAGAYVNGSDARIKENIVSIDSGLDVVAKLNPVTYTYKDDWSKDQSIQTGFIAQDLLVALEGKNYVDGIVQQGGEYMSVAYQNIIPILTKAIQEQQTIINDLKARIETLEAK